MVHVISSLIPNRSLAFYLYFYDDPHLWLMQWVENTCYTLFLVGKDCMRFEPLRDFRALELASISINSKMNIQSQTAFFT